MSETRVVFVERAAKPERLLCEAEIVFGDECGPLAGMKLVGFSLWKSPEGEAYVTFPSRPFGSGTDRRYFDYLRADQVEGDPQAKRKAVQAWIVAEYQASQAAQEGR